MDSQSKPLISAADLRAEARRLENALDAKLALFARLAGGEEESLPLSVCGSSASGGSERSASEVQDEIEGMLGQLHEVNDMLSRHYSSSGSATSVTTSRHVLQRHREILHDLVQEFIKIKSNFRTHEERHELLSAVRNDIREHRNSASSRSAETLLRERNAIHASDRIASDVIAQAEATKAALSSQRSVFGGVSSKLLQLSSLAPQVNALIAAVEARKLRDKLILGALLGGCISLLILYSWASG
uniref:Golgi SNAP receptor complex member 1 n=1 Tax=Calcidiscus leptoporus TaxID=127549 RepID=A0A7S0NMR4_9EUKA|mmetsp:Transcript_10276/g.23780  ORF Transcript_10276/g.23780 Transcript_10276/m.23780 type:complete len:244 (+) Transcript_10276:28-759(+)